MTKPLIWLGHIVAIGLIIAGIAAGYSFLIALGIVSEFALWVYAIFFFPKLGRPMLKSHPKQPRDGMINLRGFKGNNKEQE